MQTNKWYGIDKYISIDRSLINRPMTNFRAFDKVITIWNSSFFEVNLRTGVWLPMIDYLYISDIR
jgi:hypothetical protein